MNPLPIDPWDFALPDYLRRVRASPDDFAPYYTALKPNEFYKDDRHITAAALQLHPLLGGDAVNAVLSAMPFKQAMADWNPGTAFTELGDGRDPEVHLLLRGRARLVATRHIGNEARRWVVAQYRTGQWIGLPQVLREFDRSARQGIGWPDDIHLEAEALDLVRTQRMTLADALSIMHSHPDFRRFVEHHVAVRFARRREMIDCLRENPLLRLLTPSDREYLLQLGAIVSIPEGYAEPYLPAGPPAGRMALLLDGTAALLLPGGAGQSMRYGATLRRGDLIGHEGLLMDAEWRDPSALDVQIVEPPRVTEVRVAPGTQLLQFYWYALRWVLDNRAPVWARVKQVLSGGRAGIAAPMPTIVSFHAARPGLGTSVLAYGSGAALANAGGHTVEVVDLEGPANFEAHWQGCGFTVDDLTLTLQSGPRLQRAEGRPTELTCRVLVPPEDAAWPPGLKVIWPTGADPDMVENLVDALEMQPDVSHVVVAGSDREATGVMGGVLDRLHGRCGAVFYVCDEAALPYPKAEPEHLTWVYRMTADYLASEARHAGRVRFDWLYAGTLEAVPSPVRSAIEGWLGYSPSAELERESVQGPRRVVRVPDDKEGIQTFNRGALGDLVGVEAGRVPLGRAFARLARVVDRRTVGLALGGGGAWGFSHVALLRNLEAQGVPIDYIAGTSFGSVVGGLYAAGGMRAVERLVEENSATGRGIAPTLLALVAGSLNRSLFVAPLSSVAVETFIHSELRTLGVGSLIRPPCLGATEIPFYPVGTNLGTHEPLALPHATVGWGVRMSGSLPPVFPSLLRRNDRIADGAFVANVPSRVVRQVGAHFVISANVVPPPPEPRPITLGWSLVTWLPRKLIERLEDTLRGVFVLAWKAGQDQGELAADYALDLRPTAANLFEMWRGRDIADEIEAKHFSGPKARRIRDAWDRFHGDGTGPKRSKH